MREISSKRNGQCLSEEYIGIFHKLEWLCHKGHKWSATPNDVVNNNTWCPYCAGKRKTISDMVLLAQDRGGKCLSKKYQGNQTKLQWYCSNGHIWEATPNSIINGHWCPECNTYLTEEKCRFILEKAMKVKFKKNRRILGLNYELDGYNENLNLAFEYHGKQHYMYLPYFHDSEQDFLDQVHRDETKQDYAKQRGIKLIVIPWYSASVDSTLMEYIYNECRKFSFNPNTDFTLGDFYDNHHYCEDKFNEIQEIALNYRGKCLESYKGTKIPILFECEFGHTWSSTPSNIKNGRWCPNCAVNKRAEARKLTIESMQKIAIQRGGEILSTEYFNAHTKLVWKCADGHIFNATPNQIKSKNSWCPICGKKKSSEAHKLSIEDMNEIAIKKKGKFVCDNYLGAREKHK